MTIWTCAACAIEHPESDIPPECCEICLDDRQFVPPGGQQWTTRDELAEQGYRIQTAELEPRLHGVTTEPELGIGQRGLLVQTAAGNLLFDPPGFIDEAGVEAVRRVGGLAVVASSHPHLTGSSIQWSHAFGNVPVYVSEKDQEWIRRPYSTIELWRGRTELLPGLTMIECGGHFAGSSIVHWPAGAEGRGAVLTGDTIAIGADRKSVNVMRSYVNRIPLPERAVRRIMDTTLALDFDRLYGAFGELPAGAHNITEHSLARYISWLRDELPE